MHFNTFHMHNVNVNTDLPKPCVKQEVDEKVDGRIGYDQHVTQPREVELKASAVTVRLSQDVPQDLVDQGWQLQIGKASLCLDMFVLPFFPLWLRYSIIM